MRRFGGHPLLGFVPRVHIAEFAAKVASKRYACPASHMPHATIDHFIRQLRILAELLHRRK